MKNLPIGLYTLETIIEENLVYIDKTEIALQLIKSSKYNFLSRPRRFGKSLFVDTLKEIFEGNKALFKGLYIEDKWNFEDKYPVIRISLGGGFRGDKKEVLRSLKWQLKLVYRDLKLNFKEEFSSKEAFENLIFQLHEQHDKKVVILVDEYDKPILDNIENPDNAKEAREILKNFYSVIKNNDNKIKFLFLTGVSKFSKMNLFSGLNNINDITLNPKYGNICGYTKEDLEISFKEHLEGVDMKMVQKWYNGYNFLKDKVYNPYDILLFIDGGFRFSNYWWKTGNPSFLIKLLKQRNYYIPNFTNYNVSEEDLDSFDIDNIPLVPLLWQTGYLTIKEAKQSVFGMSYDLNIPNLEVQISLNNLFVKYLTDTLGENDIQSRSNLVQIFQKNELNSLEKHLFQLFASIPYQNFTNNKIQEYEGYYASVLFAYFSSIGYEIIAEDSTNLGRIDLSLKTDDAVFIFEFKVVEKATGNAIKQIKEKKYFEKYQDFEDIFLVGIEFGKEERNLLNLEWEKI